MSVSVLTVPEDGVRVNQAAESEMLQLRVPPPLFLMVNKRSVLAVPKSIKFVDTVRLDGGGGWVRVTRIEAVPPSEAIMILAE